MSSKPKPEAKTPVTEAKTPVLDPNTDTQQALINDPANAGAAEPLGFELAQNLGVLAEGIDIAYDNIAALLANADQEAGLPDVLLEFQLPKGVIERYIAHANEQELVLETLELVIADPATDRTLKAINFQRAMQGLKPTEFYLRLP